MQLFSSPDAKRAKAQNSEGAQEEYDLIVVGSGAGGLSTAVSAAHFGLTVLVLEKTPFLGGTSAWSGGWLWIPRNPLAQRAGIVEDIEEPKKYLSHEIGNRISDPRIDVFLKTGPEMVDFFEHNSAVDFIDGNKIPDFHSSPGHALGGRSLSAAPYDGRALGSWINKLRPPLEVISLAGMGIAAGADMAHFFKATRSLPSALYALRRLAKHGWDKLIYRRSMQLVNGNALVARLLKSAVDLGVGIKTDSRVIELIQEGGRVAGVRMECADEVKTVAARRGVVLATGGFPHDQARMAKLFDSAQGKKQHFSAAPATNTGDGMNMAEAIGAEVSADFIDAGAWAPVSRVPLKNGGFANFPHLVERAKPGVISVDESAERFVNEADSYHDFMRALFNKNHTKEEAFAWLICDHKTQRRYGLGWSKPFPFPIKPYVKNGYLKSGRSLAELARACNLDSARLVETITRFNEFARKGEDPDFDRGKSAYNQVQGDGEHKPNPSLGPVEHGPFYAVKIVPGSLGTFAGLKTNSTGQVLDKTGREIAGLYAVGNDMTSIMGGNYPSGGITLGPAMTFGYLIGKTLGSAAREQK